MTSRPILFTGPMVRAILDGRKTQTRRVVNPDLVVQNGSVFRSPRRLTKWIGQLCPVQCPYGQPGDSLWVRETWVSGPPAHESGRGIILPQPIPKAKPDGWKILYRESEGDVFVPAIPWRPGIHMPRWASRITLQITEVRVQRLLDITEEDARSEGVNPTDFESKTDGLRGREHRILFRTLWDSINGKKHPWDSNPYVWVITFSKL